jgi:hypothetical protein
MYCLVRDLGCGRDQECTERCIATYGSGRSHSNSFVVEKNRLNIIFSGATHFLLVSPSTLGELSIVRHSSPVQVRSIGFVNGADKRENEDGEGK